MLPSKVMKCLQEKKQAQKASRTSQFSLELPIFYAIENIVTGKKQIASEWL